MTMDEVGIAELLRINHVQNGGSEYLRPAGAKGHSERGDSGPKVSSKLRNLNGSPPLAAHRSGTTVT